MSTAVSVFCFVLGCCILVAAISNDWDLTSPADRERRVWLVLAGVAMLISGWVTV